jgi:hypothetical protein
MYSGTYRGSPRVGNVLYHTVGDREEVVKKLGLDYGQAFQEISRQVGVIPYEGAAERVKKINRPMWLAWWQGVATPLFAAWSKFKAEQLTGDTTGPGGDWIAYAERWETDWPIYEDWRRRLVELRAGAKSLGMTIRTPAPVALPVTLPGKIADWASEQACDVKEAAGSAWTMAKIGVYGALGLGAIIALSSVVQSVRHNEDPLEKYHGMAKEWRRR